MFAKRFSPIGILFLSRRGVCRHAELAMLFGTIMIVVGATTCQAQSPLERLERRLQERGGQQQTGSGSQTGQAQTGQAEAEQGQNSQGQLPPPLQLGPPNVNQGESTSSSQFPPRSGELLPPPQFNADSEVTTPVDLDSLQPFLGLTVVDLTRDTQATPAVPVSSGGLIEAMMEGGPANNAGLEIGSVIVAIDGRRVDSAADLDNHLVLKRPGEDVTLLVYKGTKLERKTITLGGIAGDDAAMPIASPPTLQPSELTGSEDFSENPVEVQRNPYAADSAVAEEPAGDSAPSRPEPARQGPLRILDRLPLGDRDGGLLGGREGGIIDRLRNGAEPAATEQESAEAAEELELLKEIIDLQQRQIRALEERIRQLESQRG